MDAGLRGRRGTPRAGLRIDTTGAGEALIGPPSGLPGSELEALRPRVSEAMARLEQERARGLHALLELPYRKGDIRQAIARARELREGIDAIVVLGMGGAAHGVRLLAEALLPRPGSGERVPRLIVAGDVDPWQFSGWLERVDLGRTFLHVISRSGETAETLAQFLVVRDRLLREVGAVEYTRHVLITTDAAAGPLRQIVNDEGFASTEFPAGVFGHESALSPTHLVAAAALGVDIEELLAGARAMDELCRSADVLANPAAELAATYYALSTLHGVQASVLFPYSSRLAGFGPWWQALWAQCLGQEAEREASRVPVGLTPVVALGASERQAHLQLCLEGPADKVVTFVRVADHDAHIEIPGSYGDLAEVAYLGGRSFAELLDADQAATEHALARRGRPSVSIELPAVSPHALGQLLRLTEVSLLLTAFLFGVDPHARPATETLRGLRGALLGKPGLDSAREDIEKWRAARARSER